MRRVKSRSQTIQNPVRIEEENDHQKPKRQLPERSARISTQYSASKFNRQEVLHPGVGILSLAEPKLQFIFRLQFSSLALNTNNDTHTHTHIHTHTQTYTLTHNTEKVDTYTRSSTCSNNTSQNHGCSNMLRYLQKTETNKPGMRRQFLRVKVYSVECN